MRQQQQPDDTHQNDFVSSVETEQGLPPARPSQTTRARKDTDMLEASQRQLTRDIAALSRLLNAPQPVEQLLPTALDISKRLIPQDWKLRLFQCIDSSFALHEIVSLSDQRAGATQEIWMTLGFGEAINHQVMREHRAVLTEILTIVPLTDATEAVIGVLVAMRAGKMSGSTLAADDALLSTISAHLAALLARDATERLNESSTLAVQAAARLALPSTGLPALQVGGATFGVAVSDALDAAEGRLLTHAVAALDEIIAATGYSRSAMALAVTRTQSGGWRLLWADASQEASVSFLSDDMLSSITQLAVQNTGDSVKPFEVGGETNSDIWAALGPLRTHIAEHSGKAVAHVTLLPITNNGNHVTALLCLAWCTAINDDTTRLLTLVTYIAVATIAGIRNLTLADHAWEEGRARDAFLSLSAHELRSPLTSIKGYAQLLLRQSKKTAIPESMLHSVESIEQQSVRMAEMVGELLDASRIRRGGLEIQVSPVDVASLAHKVVERRAALFPEHTITFNVAKEPILALADAQRVEQILRDLIDNGARHMPKGGAVTVTLSTQGGMALFTVRDQGIGIPKRARERIFEYLYRSSLSDQKNLSGLGLGLFISRYLVDRFGGTLWLEASSTDEPMGSEFRFTLPLAVEPMGHTQDERRL